MTSGIKLEVLLLGTGTSSQLPSISCLTEPDPMKACAACLSTSKKDARRNTSAIVRLEDSSDILIDVGKSFCEAAREHFPPNKIRKLAAVLLTHPHADAINGLDDLRAWTLGGAIQRKIPIYCNAYTLSEISKAYGYLVDKNAKTGGGDVPDFEWHVIEDGVPFQLLGITILPLQVHHGSFFGSDPKPYTCLAYLFDKSFCYMADVSNIPSATWDLLEVALRPTVSLDDPQPCSLPLLILDTLRIASHASHFGLPQAIETARRLNASRTYLLGFAHRVSHACWVHCCEAVSRGERPISEAISQPNKLARTGVVEDFGWFTQTALRAIEDGGSTTQPSKRVWVRPAFDGLWIKTDGQKAWDDEFGD